MQHIYLQMPIIRISRLSLSLEQEPFTIYQRSIRFGGLERATHLSELGGIFLPFYRPFKHILGKQRGLRKTETYEDLTSDVNGPLGISEMDGYCVIFFHFAHRVNLCNRR